MTNNLFVVIGAIIGLVSYVTAQYVNHIFTVKRNIETKRDERIAMAKFSRAVLLNLKVHMDNNLEKLISMLEFCDFGEEIDFKKLKFSENGLIALKLEDLIMLHSTLSQDIMTLSIFSRNNEMEIDAAINLLFGSLKCSDQIKIRRINKLIDRFAITIDKSTQLAQFLVEFQNSPENYHNQNSIWSKSMFSIKKT